MIKLKKKIDKIDFKKVKLYILYFIKPIKAMLTQQKNALNTITMIIITQKKHNPKAVFFEKKTIFTLSLGTCLKYLKIPAVKAFRRSFKYLKLFLNLLSVTFFRKKKKTVIFNLSGFDYNLLCLQKTITTMFLKTNLKLFFLFSIKIPFCKTKGKKIKSIKKRIKKKILLNFLEK